MRRTIDSAPVVESGIARYAEYFDLVVGPYIPPTSIRVRRRGAFFRTGATFAICVSRLAKAFQMLGCRIDRRDSALVASIRGLKHDRISLIDLVFSN